MIICQNIQEQTVREQTVKEQPVKEQEQPAGDETHSHVIVVQQPAVAEAIMYYQ